MKLGPNYGVMKLTSKPDGADVWINGEPTGQTTPYTSPMKKAGEYDVTLKKKMYLSKTMKATLGNGKTENLNAILEPNFGSLRVTTEPDGARIIIDGTDTGQTTPATITPVRIGGRNVVLKREAHNDYKKLVKIERGKETKLSASLTGQMGLLKIVAFMEEDGREKPVLGADVYIDGEKQTGKTPFKKKLLVGEYEIKVENDDGRFEGKTSVREGKEASVKAVLEGGDGKLSADGKTWLDRESGLMWQVDPPDKEMKWQAAKDYCSKLNYGGYSDWRLPSISELGSLIRGCEKGRQAAQKPEYFGGCSKLKGPANGYYWPDAMRKAGDGKYQYFWSSSSYANGTSYAWGVYFSSGYVDNNDKSINDDARCVRGGP